MYDGRMKKALAFRFFVWVAFAMIFLSGAARAQGNLVINGGFESPNTGWEGVYMTWQPTQPVGNVRSGNFVGAVIDVSRISQKPMSQRLSTEPMVPYLLEFSLRSARAGSVYNEDPLPVTVKWDSHTVGDSINLNTSSWQTFRVNLTAESTATDLSFVTLGYTVNWIDDISVTAVPEPTSVTLGTAAALATIIFRRKRNAP